MVGARVEFAILGPLEVRRDGVSILVGGPKQRALLALLLCNANHVVSRERLIDELLDDQPGGSAEHVLHVQISRLRKALADDGEEPRLLARPPGYTLRVEEGELDLHAFEQRLAEGRRALEHGDPGQAAKLLADAEALWRGRPLADLEFEPFARLEVQRLEELRLLALEERIEAELALGHHAAVCPELEALAEEYPLRERLRGQLVLALYRSGRQADALESYRAGRAVLVEELALEPGPALRKLQTKILRHDPTLDLPQPAASARGEAKAIGEPDGRVRSVRTWLAAALVVAALVVLVVLISSEGSGNTAVARTLRAPAFGLFDIGTGQPSAAIPLGVVATSVTAGDGSDWATSYGGGMLLQISPNDDAVVQHVRVGVGASGVAVDDGDVWVANTLQDRVTRVNAATDDIVQQIPVGTAPSDIAVGAGAVWVTNQGSGTVSRIDPLTGGVVNFPVGPSPTGVAVGDGAVWIALSGADAVAELEPQTGHLQQTISVSADPVAITVGRAGVWVADELDRSVSLINPVTDGVLTWPVEGAPEALVPTGNAVWVAGDLSQLTRLSSSGLTRTIAVPSPATALAASSGRLLVAVTGNGAAHRGGMLIVRISNPEPSIDPAQCCNTPGNVDGLAYDGLLAFSKNPASPGTLVPDLALAIPKPEDSGLSYTFHLRPGLRYWNGTTVRASDFRRGLELAAQDASTWAAYLTALPGAAACAYAPSCDLSSAVITNDKAETVTLRLSRPDPGLLTALGLLAFAPAPAGGGIRPGTGPYRIARIVPNRLIVFTRNPYFREWAPAAQPAGYPNQIDVYMNGTPSADVQAVLQGRADYTFDQPTASQLREIDLLSPGLLHSEPLPDTDYLDLDTQLAPFNDVRVRQALNYAINRNTIVKLYGGPANATPTCQIIPVTIPGHVPYCPSTLHPSPDALWSAPNLARARQLVALSGTRGQTVTVRTQSDFGPAGEPVATYIVHVLRQLGYRPHLYVVTADEVATGAVSTTQIITNSWVADVPSPSDWITISLSCRERGPQNEDPNQAEFCDPAIDRLAARATALEATNPVAADRLWAAADREITNLAPWVPTVTETENDVVSTRVGNYQYVPTFGALLDQLWVR